MVIGHDRFFSASHQPCMITYRCILPHHEILRELLPVALLGISELVCFLFNQEFMHALFIQELNYLLNNAPMNVQGEDWSLLTAKHGIEDSTIVFSRLILLVWFCSSKNYAKDKRPAQGTCFLKACGLFYTLGLL